MPIEFNPSNPHQIKAGTPEGWTRFGENWMDPGGNLSWEGPPTNYRAATYQDFMKDGQFDVDAALPSLSYSMFSGGQRSKEEVLSHMRDNPWAGSAALNNLAGRDPKILSMLMQQMGLPENDILDASQYRAEYQDRPNDGSFDKSALMGLMSFLSLPLMGAAGGWGGAGGGGGAGGAGSIFNTSFLTPEFLNVAGAGEFGASATAFNPLETLLGNIGMDGGMLSKLAMNLAPGGPVVPGSMEEILQKLGLKTGGGPLSLLWSLGTGLYGMDKARKVENAGMDAANRMDPFGPQRAMYQQQLSDLASNPGKVTSLPGYKAGLDAVERKMASQGYLGSGNMMLALHDYGGRMYDSEMQRLMQLAGANFAPSGGDNIVRGRTAATDIASKSLAGMGYGIRGLENLIWGT